MFAQDYEEFGPFGRGRGRGGTPPPPPPPPHFGGVDGGFRAGRGMMEPAIIGALSEKPMHGYEIITYLEEKTHGVWRPSPGSVYPTLQMMEEKGSVTSQEQDGKKIYELTDEGKKESETSREHLRAAFERFADMDQRDGKRMNLHHAYQRQFHKDMGEIIKQMRHIFRKGTKQQKDAMAEAIADFKSRMDDISRGEI